MRRNMGWKHSLGIGFEIPPVGQRNLRSGNGAYSETMHKFELWLRDAKGFTAPKQFDYDTGVQLRREFLLTHAENHPEYFSKRGLRRTDDCNNNYSHEYPYACVYCGTLFNGLTLDTCNCK